MSTSITGVPFVAGLGLATLSMIFVAVRVAHSRLVRALTVMVAIVLAVTVIPGADMALVTRQGTMRGLVDAMFGYRPIETLAAAPARLLVLVAGAGTADDEVARERQLALGDVLDARSAAGLSEARVVRLPGTGHNLMRYRPGALGAELLALAATTGVSM